jgi:hypothetical protein
MRPPETIEAAFSKIALIESFYVLIHDVKEGYQIVEKKRISDGTLIIESPAFSFFHKSFVNTLIQLGGNIRVKDEVRIFSRVLGESWNDYVSVEIGTKVSIKKIYEPEYRPAVVSELEETGAMFFSKTAIEKLKEVGLAFVELPAFPNIIPVGSA